MTDSTLLMALLSQTLQIAVLAGLVAVVARLAGPDRPWLCYSLWLLVLLKCVTPPVWSHRLSPFSQAHVALPALVAGPSLQVDTTRQHAHETDDSHNDAAPLLIKAKSANSIRARNVVKNQVCDCRAPDT